MASQRKTRSTVHSQSRVVLTKFFTAPPAVARREKSGGYVVVHTNGERHRAGERCLVCERLKARTEQ
jgi:hypothetical protein